MIKVSSFTDESGQDTKGKVFVVCTVCVASDKAQEVEEKLLDIERKSGKSQKWFNSGNKRRHAYVRGLLESTVLKDIILYCSLYKNKSDYVSLVGAHVAKSVLAFAGDNSYEAKIFIDKMDKRSLESIKKEIKLFHIRYKKIRGLSDEASSLIRLADAACGIVRDLDNKVVADSFKDFSNRLRGV